jgi:mono/diheme cytochrome c family protein
MKNLKQIVLIGILLVFGISLTSFGQKAKPWDVPANFKAMSNPVKSDDASLLAGKDLFNKNCAACHGKTGVGDGPKSKGLKTTVASFLTAECQTQTDGELFYKSKTGRGDMPKYEGKIEDTGLWQTVNYIRSLKK